MIQPLALGHPCHAARQSWLVYKDEVTLKVTQVRISAHSEILSKGSKDNCTLKNIKDK